MVTVVSTSVLGFLVSMFACKVVRWVLWLGVVGVLKAGVYSLRVLNIWLRLMHLGGSLVCVRRVIVMVLRGGWANTSVCIKSLSYRVWRRGLLRRLLVLCRRLIVLGRPSSVLVTFSLTNNVGCPLIVVGLLSVWCRHDIVSLALLCCFVSDLVVRSNLVIYRLVWVGINSRRVVMMLGIVLRLTSVWVVCLRVSACLEEVRLRHMVLCIRGRMK